MKMHPKFCSTHHDGVQDVVSIPYPTEGEAFERAIVFLGNQEVKWIKYGEEIHFYETVTRVKIKETVFY